MPTIPQKIAAITPALITPSEYFVRSGRNPPELIWPVSTKAAAVKPLAKIIAATRNPASLVMAAITKAHIAPRTVKSSARLAPNGAPPLSFALAVIDGIPAVA
jgi:hypothetical protein